jgi:PPM family protein phosphatase
MGMPAIEGLHALPTWILILAFGFLVLLCALPIVFRRRAKEPIPQLFVEEDADAENTLVGDVAGLRDLPRLRDDDADAEDEKTPTDSCPIVPIAFDYEALEEEITDVQPLFHLDAVGRTDRGVKRRQNEDSVLVSATKRLCVVADGMGGHLGGAIASKLAVDAISEAIEQGTFLGIPHRAMPRRASEIARAIQVACGRIREAARRDPSLESMGTTVVAARFLPEKGRVYVGHVGDSRCYRFREGLLQQMTHDHTMASFGVQGKSGEFLSRAVGPRPYVLTDVVVAKPRIGDVYLLCSDGLTKSVPDSLIRDALDIYWDLDRAAERLVELANRRGGVDNVSVVLARVGVHCDAEN